MTLEIRKTGVVDVHPPLRDRARTYALEVRARATTVSRRHAWTVWQLARQVPRTVLLLAAYAPRGLGRVTAAWARYLRDNDTVELRSHHAGQKETGDYVKASQVRSANLTARLMVNGSILLGILAVVLAWTAPRALGVLLGLLVFVWTIKLIPGRGWNEVGVAAGLGALVFFAAPGLAAYVPRPPVWLWWTAAGIALVALGWIGRPRTQPLVTLPESALGGRVPPLTAPMVTAALCTLGDSKMKEADDIRLLSDPHRHGPGVQVDLELPPGVPASFVMKKREEFAAALRRELGTVWPAVGPRHPGHLALFVSDQPMARAIQPPWPLLKPSATVDLFRPFPAFTDQRGRWVDITLAYANMIVGAVPRMGKTFVVRELLLCAGLDARAKVYAMDGKGTGDLAACAMFAHFYSVGDEPEEIERVLAAMRALRQELRRRARVIREMSSEDAPENKVTSQLASNRAYRLEPIVVGMDETQVYFEYGDAKNKDHKAIRDELADIVSDLVKRGPALGIIVILATQTVTKDTIPTPISNNAVMRFCLKMTGQDPNDRVLGTGSYRRGLDASMFDIEDKGIGYLKADGSVPIIVRSVFGLDAVESEKIGRRARQLRVDSGYLTREEGDDPGPAPLDIVSDVEQVLVDRVRSAAHLVEIVEWLGELRPDYSKLDAAELGKRLRNERVRVPQVKVGGRTTSGVHVADLRKQDDDEALDRANLEDS